VSNGVTIPVAASGKTCADGGDPLTPAVLQSLSAKGTLRFGFLVVGRNFDVVSNATTVDVVGDYRRGTTAYLLSITGPLSVGNCITSSYSSPGDTTPLDAGQAIRLSSAGASLLLIKKQFSSTTAYEATAPATFVPSTGGDFAFANTTAGTDVQQFSTTVTVPSNFAWTNSAALATVDRQGATFTWSGGSGAPFVSITGVAFTDSGFSAFFRCQAPTSAGQFTVPASVLLAMPSGPGSLYLEAVGSQQTFTAPGLDWGNVAARNTLTRSTRF